MQALDIAGLIGIHQQHLGANAVFGKHSARYFGLEGDVVEVGQPFVLIATLPVFESGRHGVAVDAFGLDLDEIDGPGIRILDQDVDTHKIRRTAQGRFGHYHPTGHAQTGPGLRPGLFVVQRLERDALAHGVVVVLELGQLADLVPAIGQGLQKVVVFVPVKVAIGLLGIEKLGRAFQGQLEQGFREVAGFDRGVHALCSNDRRLLNVQAARRKPIGRGAPDFLSATAD